jgi:transcriptional antiterminator NusG
VTKDGRALLEISTSETPAIRFSESLIRQEENWFAVQTRPRHEKRVALALECKGICAFLPVHRAVRQWSDRKQVLELPLFSNYVFVKTDNGREARAGILRTDGVVRFVGSGGLGTAIPEEQMDAIRTVIKEEVAFTHHPFLTVGQKVRIRGGSLDGVQGIFLSTKGDQSLIVSVETIQRSLALRVDGYVVEAI